MLNRKKAIKNYETIIWRMKENLSLGLDNLTSLLDIRIIDMLNAWISEFPSVKEEVDGRTDASVLQNTP